MVMKTASGRGWRGRDSAHRLQRWCTGVLSTVHAAGGASMSIPSEQAGRGPAPAVHVLRKFRTTPVDDA
jgi:hypothetical protein